MHRAFPPYSPGGACFRDRGDPPEILECGGNPTSVPTEIQGTWCYRNTG